MTREEAIDIIKCLAWHTRPNEEDIEQAIKTLNPKPKMGQWIDDKCSVCGKGIEDLIDSREWYRNEEPKFCPFCGIRIIESER